MDPNTPPLSVYDALSGKRLRLQRVPEGTQLCARILGYCRHAGGLTVYLAGTTPPAMRAAVEEGRTQGEVLFADLAGGIQEVELADARHELRLLLPCYELHTARLIPLLAPLGQDDALAA